MMILSKGSVQFESVAFKQSKDTKNRVRLKILKRCGVCGVCRTRTPVNTPGYLGLKYILLFICRTPQLPVSVPLNGPLEYR